MREARLMCFETTWITIRFHLNYMIIPCTIEDCFGCLLSFWGSKLSVI